jgi:hypothetical protein
METITDAKQHTSNAPRITNATLRVSQFSASCPLNDLIYLTVLVRTKPSARKSEVLTTWDQIQRFNGEFSFLLLLKLKLIVLQIAKKSKIMVLCHPRPLRKMIHGGRFILSAVSVHHLLLAMLHRPNRP